MRRALAFLAALPAFAAAEIPAFNAPTTFRVEVVSERRGPLAAATPGYPAHLTASEGETYAVRLSNPLPVPVAVGLTVDGLNTVTGAGSRAPGGARWLVEPHATALVSGWQVGPPATRRFLFAWRDESYAFWRSRRDPSIEPRFGEIAAAFFWSSADLSRARARRDEPPGVGPSVSPAQPTTATGDAGMFDPDAAVVVTYSFSAGMPWRGGRHRYGR